MDALGLTPELLLFQTPSDDCSTDCSNRPGAFCRLPIRDESDARYSSCSLQLTDVGGVVFDTVVAGDQTGIIRSMERRPDVGTVASTSIMCVSGAGIRTT